MKAKENVKLIKVCMKSNFNFNNKCDWVDGSLGMASEEIVSHAIGMLRCSAALVACDYLFKRFFGTGIWNFSCHI